jgi:hypothetical protein
MEQLERVRTSGRRPSPHQCRRLDRGREDERPREHGRRRIRARFCAGKTVCGDQEVELGGEQDDVRHRHARQSERGSDGEDGTTSSTAGSFMVAERDECQRQHVPERDRRQDAGEALACEHERDAGRHADRGAGRLGERNRSGTRKSTRASEHSPGEMREARRGRSVARAAGGRSGRSGPGRRGPGGTPSWPPRRTVRPRCRRRGALTSWGSYRNRSCSRSAARLSGLPVTRESTQTTSHPSATSRSQRWDPRNPAPPVIRARSNVARRGRGRDGRG